MSVEPGASLLHYTLTEKIGEGGMGAVWRATDTTLNRDVAIKILPREFAEDPDRLARFEREAKTLAALNHPNIAAVYGLHQTGDTRVSSRWSSSRARISSRCSSAVRFPPTRRSTSRSRSPRAWTPRTRRASCTAI